jgi:hypothetical protein
MILLSIFRFNRILMNNDSTTNCQAFLSTVNRQEASYNFQDHFYLMLRMLINLLSLASLKYLSY